MGDLIYGYSDINELGNFKKLLSEYRTGELERLTVDQSITFLGLDIRLLPSGEFSMSQKSIIGRMKFADVGELVKNRQIIVAESAARTFFRRHLGSLIWALKTRFGVGYMVTMLASPYVTKDGGGILEMIKLGNRIIETVKIRRRDKVRALFPRSTPATEFRLRSLRLFSFADAGYASLRDKKSIGAAIFILVRKSVAMGLPNV